MNTNYRANANMKKLVLILALIGTTSFFVATTVMASNSDDNVKVDNDGNCDDTDRDENQLTAGGKGFLWVNSSSSLGTLTGTWYPAEQENINSNDSIDAELEFSAYCSPPYESWYRYTVHFPPDGNWIIEVTNQNGNVIGTDNATFYTP